MLYWAVAIRVRSTTAPCVKATTCSAVRCSRSNPATGTRKWHYQFTPHDTHDWDSNQDMILVDRSFHGQPRKLLMHADRNGHFYVLDRTNGKFLSGRPSCRRRGTAASMRTAGRF
jgi:alcohol dehydrogenase (cytochrome c)